MAEEEVYHVRSSALSYNQQGQKTSSKQKTPKSTHITIAKSRIACIGSVGPSDDVAATHAFCDGLRLVGWVDPSCLTPSAKQIGDFAPALTELWAKARLKLHGKDDADGVAFKFVKTDGYLSGKTRVGVDQAGAVVGVGTGKSHEKKTRFRLALHFNPRRLGPTGLAELEKVLASVFSETLNFDRWLATANVAAIDIAVDLINLEVCDAILRSEDGEKWSAWFSKTGRVETWSRLRVKNKRGKSPPILVLYDKRRELLDAGKQPTWAALPHARLELRQRQNKRPFVGLGNLKSPFSEVSMGHAGLVAEKEGQDFRLYFAASRWMGFEAASHLIDEKHAWLWKQHIRAGNAPFWQPTAIWNDWRGSLKRDGLWSWITRASKSAAQPTASN